MGDSVVCGVIRYFIYQ